MPGLSLRDHRYLGATQSLCPECYRLVPAKILDRFGRVYFRKNCPEHGMREDFICSEVNWFDRMEYSLPGKIPLIQSIEPRRGCPYDCGLCTEHEQHTCVAVLEITESCNLTCPMCYAASAPGGKHLSVEDCCKAIDRLVACEGRAEILQLSGGEPTVHPEFERIFRYACEQSIDVVMINTNGIRIARDPRLRELLAEYRRRCEVYLQFDGFRGDEYSQLRGEDLTEVKLQAVELLGEAGVNVTLVCTVERELNLDQVSDIVRFGLERPQVTGVSFQPATYVGRCGTPKDLEQRVTFPEIIQSLSAKSAGLCSTDDFLPLPCAHPNAHWLSFFYRSEGKAVPLKRFIDIENHLDLLANGITFNRGSARELIAEFLSRNSCGCDGGCGPVALPPESVVVPIAGKPASQIESELALLASQFFASSMAEEISPADVFRITTTSFMDAYNFDIRQLMKSCVHHLLPSGHLIPFDAYNLLYRDGRVPLPELIQQPSPNQLSLPVVANVDL